MVTLGKSSAEIYYEVKFGGRIEAGTDERGRFRVRWIPETEVKGEAYGTPMWARPQFIHFSKGGVPKVPVALS